MDFFFVALIIAAVVIGGMIVLNRYRGFEGYRRRLPVSGKAWRSRSTRESGQDGGSSIYLTPSITGGTDGGGHHGHGSVDCGSGHGGDAGGGCSDGGGGGGGHGG